MGDCVVASCVGGWVVVWCSDGVLTGCRMLIDAFDRDQMERYNVWRRVKLKKETVRRVGHHNNTLAHPHDDCCTFTDFNRHRSRIKHYPNPSAKP